MGSQVFVATQSGSAYDKKSGESYTFIRGTTRVREGHPLLRLVPDYFEPVDENVHYEIEQATKGPGERRGARGAVAAVASAAKGAAKKPAKTQAAEPAAATEPAPAPGGLTLASLSSSSTSASSSSSETDPAGDGGG